MNAGDSVEIVRFPFKSAPKPDVIRGLLLGKFNRFSDTSIMILNNEVIYPRSFILRYFFFMIHSLTSDLYSYDTAWDTNCSKNHYL